jgi:hypothetical protein
MARKIQVFEFEKLTLQKDQHGRVLYLMSLERLYAYNDNNTISILRV